jgi:hypothetical protein
MGAFFREADLSDANLSGADLSQADLSDANLSGADLRKANFRGANLSRSNLYAAIATPNDLLRAELTPKQVGSIRLVPISQRQGRQASSNESASHFAVVVPPGLSAEQMLVGFEALADYYRACGGVGFKIEFEFQSSLA